DDGRAAEGAVAADDAADAVTDAGPTFGAPPASRYVLSVSEVAVGYRFLGLIGSQPRLQRVRLTRPDLDLDRMETWLDDLAEIRASRPPSDGAGGIRIANLEINDGMIRRDRQSVISQLRLNGSVSGADEVWRLSIDDGGARVRTERIEEDVELTGNVKLDDGAAHLDGLHLSAGGGRLSFRGTVAAEDVDLSASGFAIPLDRLASWVGVEHPALSGELEFRFHGSGAPDSLVVRGGLRGVDDDGTERDIRLALGRLRDEVIVESLEVHSGESQLEAAGRFTLADPPRIDGVAVFRSLDPAVMLAEADLHRLRDLDGTVQFEGTGTNRATFDGTVRVNVSRGEVFGLGLNAAKFEARIRDGGVALDSAELRRGDSYISGTGSIDAQNIVSAEFTGTIADLGDLDAVTGENVSGALEGQAIAEVSVRGPLAHPALEALFRFEDARVVGARAEALDLTLESDALKEGTEFRIGAVGRGVGYGDRVIPVAYATGGWSGGAIRVTDLRLETARRGELRLEGELDLTGDGDLSGRVTRLEVGAPDGGPTWKNAQPVQIVRTERLLNFTGLDLRSGSARVTGDVSVQPSGETYVKASGVGVDLEVFSPFLLPPRPLVGVLDFNADARIGADTLAVDLSFDLEDGAYGNDVVDRAEGTIRMSDDTVTLDNVVFRTALATAEANGNIGLRGGSFRAALGDSVLRARLADDIQFHDLAFVFESPDADRFKEVFPWFPSPGGKIRFTADVDGETVSPAMQLELTCTEGRVGTERLDLLQADGTFDGQMVRVDSAQIVSGDGVVIARGNVPVAWSLLDLKPRFRAGGEMNLGFTGRAVPAGGLAILTDLFEMGAGPIDADGRLTGVVDSLLWLEGTFSSVGGVLTVPEFADPFVDGVVNGSFTQAGIELDEIRFSDGQGGTVTGSGVVELPNLKFTGMNILLEGRDYHYRSPRGVSGLGNGYVRITEKPRSDGKLIGNFEGAFDVIRAEIDERLFLEAQAAAELVPEMPEGVQLPDDAHHAPGDTATVVADEPAILFARIDLEADKNVWIKTNVMEVELAGEVTFHITEDYLGLTGFARSLRGRYAVLNTDFNVDRSEVRFVDPANMFNSIMDAEASCRVLDEEVTYEVTGTVGEPIVVGRTESGMNEAEIFELLALRTKRSTDDRLVGVDTGVEGEGEWRDAFLESWGTLLATRFGRGISREIGLDTFDVVVDGQSRNLRLGKYLGPDVFVRYRERLSGTTGFDETLEVESLETPERQLLLEYRLSEIFQLQGETGVIQDDPYLNIDLKAEWGY
ncbi:MAG: hypothetical protein HKN12_02035, partial [Gemmatimonadetes bacterium]|nr:hypothetical protein [Gemmatimonadota bacterium]